MGIIKYTQTQIISEFKNDFDDALEKFRKRKIQFTGVLQGLNIVDVEKKFNLELNLIQHIGKTMELLQFC